MKLLFQRDQKAGRLFSLIPLRIGSGVVFTLMCQIELTEEENSLLKKYKLTHVPIVVSDPIDDFKASFRPAFFLGFVTFVVSSIFTTFSSAFVWAALITLGMTITYFRTLREQINVNHLTEGGRTFYCESVVTLAEKEDYLAEVSQHLRQLIELAKNWGDKDIIEIEPLDRDNMKPLLVKLI